MVWLYDKTSSLFLTILMHMSLTFCALSFQSVTQSGIDFAIYDSVLAAVIWVLIFLIIRKRPDPVHPELP